MENEGTDGRRPQVFANPGIHSGNGADAKVEEVRPGEPLERWEESEKTRLIMDAARDYAIILFDLQGKVISWSHGAQSILGYSEEEILGQSGTKFFTPDDVAAGIAAKEMEQAARVGRADDERWHIRKDGNRFFASGVMTSIWDRSGRLVGYCKVLRDITDRMLAQEALRQSQQYFADLVDSIDGIVWEADGNSKTHTFVSKKAEDILGHPVEKWIKDYWNILIYEEDRPKARAQWEKAFVEKKGYTMDLRLVDSLGRKRWFRDYVSAVEQASGSVKLRAVLVEISAQKAVERRQEMQIQVTSILAASSSLSKAASEILPILGQALEWDAAIFWYLDRKKDALMPLKTWKAGSEKLAQLLRMSRSKNLPRGEDPAGIALGSKKPVWVPDMAKSSAGVHTERMAWAREEGVRAVFACPILLGDDALGAIEFFSTLPREEEPAVVGIATAIGSQIGLFAERLRTEEALWNSQEQLRQSQKMEAIGRLAGGVAHDFNNLLTAINGYSDLLLSRLEPTSPYLEHVGEISKAGKRAASLTYQLLAYSRKQVMAPKILNLNTIMSDMGAMLERLLGEDIRLDIRLAPDLYPVKMDPGQFEQVIMNLAVNSRDAMPTGGVLILETSNARISEQQDDVHLNIPPGDYVRLSVGDTGRGIEESVRDRLFEPFFTTKEAGKGTGLGLSMVYGIVQQSGGFISVNSEVGKGATFTLHLPRAKESEKPPAAGQSATRDRQGGHETIMLVEDEEGVRKLAHEILANEGFTVLAASGGEEALLAEMNHPGPVHLLVTDFIMPGMNGREVFEALSVRRPNMQVLYMSGYTEDAIVRHGVETSGSAFLQKPFSPNALVEKVQQLLKAVETRA